MLTCLRKHEGGQFAILEEKSSLGGSSNLTAKTQNALSVQNIRKVYGDPDSGVVALENVSMEIRENEFFTLLGPSGCGKSTLLRMIAGFESATAGELLLFGEAIEHLPPNKRPVNMVFQNYALFPHMTVAENIGFALNRLGHEKVEIIQRVDEVLDLVQLRPLAARLPDQLSGGQQQRVALARALAPSPRILLLDEPLSALDLKLRQSMRIELKELQESTGITFVFVTHDQEEALTMSDRIAVMSDGAVQQIGSPTEIYDTPVNRFVADFIGNINLVPVKVDRTGPEGHFHCTTRNGDIVVCSSGTDIPGSDGLFAAIRPERLRLVSAGEKPDFGKCTVKHLIYMGTDSHCVLETPDGIKITVRNQNAHGQQFNVRPGDVVGAKIDPGAARLLGR